MSSIPAEHSVDRVVGSEDSGPTVMRMVLGSQLRRLRIAAGVTRGAAGYEIRCSHTKISRMELGQVSFKRRDVADLLGLYGVSDDTEREAILALAAQANAHGWWHGFADLMPGWFEVYVGLEEAASVIRCYEAQFIPGLLQSEDYARAVIHDGYPLATAEEIERRVRLRMNRARLVHSAEPPRIWAVLDEAALRRQPGGAGVMRAQLTHLLQLCQLPHVTVQVAPFARGGPAAAGPFTILRFAEPALPDIVYLEQLTGAAYLDKREDLDAYTTVVDQLCVQALSPSETVGFLTRLVEGY
ncbi:helix-turn-helix domain-containing protein [Catenulispora sp. NL8]|uniref:Helix-turn-helix domain-containing protein n=1 Tax=Catenulispora pinistramenti TaxID=2705254 RepID=A0ABS5KZH2_9ACTN|nr:helix-turn-helix transcriptional regulator [Catenulispora pinistramenti]MBS2551310.1 helix-turn-helix domain-containing protein [Catenulispora pinistramenti]